MAIIIQVTFWLSLIFGLNCISSAGGLETGDYVEIGVEIFKVTGKFFPYLDKAVTLWDTYEKVRDIVNPKTDNTEKILTSLATKVDQISKDMNYYHADLTQNIKELEVGNELDRKMADIYGSIVPIRNFFEELTLIFQKKNFTYDHLKGPISDILDKKGVKSILKTLVSKLSLNEDTHSTVLDLLLNQNIKDKKVCLSKSSIQQLLYFYYRKVHDTLIQGLLMSIYAYRVDRTNTPKVNEDNIALALLEHYRMLESVTELFNERMDLASRDFWMCDPESPQEGKTYERFGRAFQKYLFNVKNILNETDQKYDKTFVSDFKDACIAECPNLNGVIYRFYTEKRNELKYDYSNQGHIFETRHKSSQTAVTLNEERASTFMHKDDDSNRCKGILRDCTTIEETDLQICKPGRGKVERYSYIKAGDKWTYGSEACNGEIVEAKRPYYYGPFNKAKPCSYCMCTCDYRVHEKDALDDAYLLPDLDTDRYIDLNPAIADKGYVVTGVRIKKTAKKRLFHLEIKQGKLLPGGLVFESEWKTFDTHYPLERSERFNFTRYDTKMFKEGSDYHRISYKNTIFFLDDVVAESDDQVVTGVTFDVHRPDKNKDLWYVGLYVIFSKFDMKSGTISDKHEIYPKSVKTLGHRNHIRVDNLDLPTRYNKQNNKKTFDSAYVELANSGLKIDVGQNVLPFIDVQPVDTHPPIPLAGVGLYHRGFKDSGGYIGLKATGINIKSYLPDLEFLHSEVEKLRNEWISSAK